MRPQFRIKVQAYASHEASISDQGSIPIQASPWFLTSEALWAPTSSSTSTQFLPRAQISTSHLAPTSSKADFSSDAFFGSSSSPKAKSKYFIMYTCAVL